MFDSPLSASAYEVLGVDPQTPEHELRRAFRTRLRQTHPDAGGDATAFIRVQHAWELVGTPAARAAYDRGHGFSTASDQPRWDGWRPPPPPGDTRPRARSAGTPGGQHRTQYVQLLRELHGAEIDPYDPVVVRTAPVHLRRLLADALAEEATARAVSALGMGFTVWHDVAAGAGGASGTDAAGAKLDHIVLGPAGLYGIASEDFGDTVRFRRGEIIGRGVADREPVAELLAAMRTIARAARVRFSGALIVAPDDDLHRAIEDLGAIRGIPVAVVSRSALATVLRRGVPGARVIGGNEVFDVRTRLQQTVRFV